MPRFISLPFLPAALAAAAVAFAALDAQAQAVPPPKPPLYDTDSNEPAQRHLGDIQEQTPLMAPKSELFAPPEPAAKQAPLAPEPPTAAQILANYPLNESLLARLEKIHAEILRLPDTDDEDTDDDISGGVDVLVKALEKRPDVMGILGRNLMSAADYVTAMQAVANALAAAANAEDRPGFSESGISAANFAFGRKYANRIRALLEE